MTPANRVMFLLGAAGLIVGSGALVGALTTVAASVLGIDPGVERDVAVVAGALAGLAVHHYLILPWLSRRGW